jgi:hypothetical protein
MTEKFHLISMTGGWTPGYTFHGDAIKVFREFFGGDNPFSGEQGY